MNRLLERAYQQRWDEQITRENLLVHDARKVRIPDNIQNTIDRVCQSEGIKLTLGFQYRTKKDEIPHGVTQSHPSLGLTRCVVVGSDLSEDLNQHVVIHELAHAKGGASGHDAVFYERLERFLGRYGQHNIEFGALVEGWQPNQESIRFVRRFYPGIGLRDVLDYVAGTFPVLPYPDPLHLAMVEMAQRGVIHDMGFKKSAGLDTL